MDDYTWDSSSPDSTNIYAYRAPAFFELTNVEATGTSIGPFSFTVAEKPKNDLLSSGFEPLSFRYRFSAQRAADHEVFADTSIYDQYASGLFDNATARVYRMVDGQFTEVRRSKVQRYRSSGWANEFLASNSVVAPSQRSAAVRIPGWYAHPHQYYLKVVAVDAQGAESNGSAASIHWERIDDYVSQPSIVLSSVRFPEGQGASSHVGDRESSSIPAPTNFQVSQDATSGLVMLSWDFRNEDMASIEGFRFYRSSWPSEQQEGFSILLAEEELGVGGAGGGGSVGVPILQNDMVFLDHSHTRWSRVSFTSARTYETSAVRWILCAFCAYSCLCIV